MESSGKGGNKTYVTEYNVRLLVDKNPTCPKKSEVFYNEEITLNRTLITTALAAYVERGNSCFGTVHCLDGIGASGVVGFLWKKYVGDKTAVTINDSRTKAYEGIKHNAELNALTVEILNRDPCALLHEQTYHFVSLDCHASAAHYLDSAFRNLPNGGILAITTTDDAALHPNAETALKNYGGFVTRTFYSKELAVRLLVAAMARAAARYNKGINVLCSVGIKSSFTVLVTVTRGSTHANETVRNIRKLIHCTMCEDRVFCPVTNYLIDSPTSLLGCGCSSRFPGKVTLELGPVWSGSIFSEEFLVAMRLHSLRFPWKDKADVLLLQLLQEARCSYKNENELLQPQVGSCVDKHDNGTEEEEEEDEESHTKKLKVDDDDKESVRSGNQLAVLTVKNDNNKPTVAVESDIQPAPPFYFNLHRHSPKGPRLLPVDTVIQFLRNAGYRASRTHFDREAVRTNANLSNLITVLTEAANINVH